MDERRLRIRLLDEVLAEDRASFSGHVRERCHARLEEPRVGLLEDVLADGDAAAWGRGMRAQLRGRAGRSRMRWVAASAAAAALLMALLLVGRGGAREDGGEGDVEPPMPPSTAATRVPRHLVRSRPLARYQRAASSSPVHVVRTHRRGAVRTVRHRGLRAVTAHRLQRIGPALRTRVPLLSDGELLAALAGRAVALVRRGPGAAELVLLDPRDEEELVPGAPADGAHKDG